MKRIVDHVKKYKKYYVWAFLIVVFYLAIKKAFSKKKKDDPYSNNVDYDASRLQDNSLDENQKRERILQLRQYAEDLSHAFWNFRVYAWGTIVYWRITEDEDWAIRILNSLNDSTEANFVSEYYRQYNTQWDTGTLTTPQKGMSLKQDVFKFLSASQIARIPRDIYNSLK